jgi:arginine/lysine/ornithine decarboxylase
VDDLELVTVMSPRDAFFARTEDVAIAQAARRVCADQVTPYPPGIPVLLPGERIAEPAFGVRLGMAIPDAADPGLDTIRVVA